MPVSAPCDQISPPRPFVNVSVVVTKSILVDYRNLLPQVKPRARALTTRSTRSRHHRWRPAACKPSHLLAGAVELARQLIEAHRTILEMPEDRARPLSAKDAHAAFDGARLGACLCPHLAIRSLRRDHSSTSPLWLQKVYWLIIETCCPKSSHERGL